MKLKGIYTVKQNNKVLSKSKNQITVNGFRLIQNWFASTKTDKIKLTDVNDQTTILISKLQSDNSTYIKQIFSDYTGKYYYTTSKDGCYINILFGQRNDGDQWTLKKRKISAIGIDVVKIITNSQQYNDNSNLQIRYSDNIQMQEDLNDRSDFVVPISIKNNGFNKNEVGYEQKIFYLNNPTQMSQIKIVFNSFCDTFIQYYIYAINLYQEQQIITPPTHMSLYDENGNVVFFKQIQLSYPNSSNGYSTVFKTTVPYDALDSTIKICAVSTDYYENGQKKQFSYSEYSVPWYQQQMTNIQLQYELFFSNQNGNESDNSQNSDNSLDHEIISSN